MATLSPSLSFARDGAERFDSAAMSCLAPLREALRDLPPGQAGVRLFGDGTTTMALADDGAVAGIAAHVGGRGLRPVRVLYFDKTAATNWALGWHQDRTICVRKRVMVDGFGPWTVKAGVPHVAPPFDLLARMVTLRVHLDDVPRTNAPLLIAPGSHRQGLVPVGAIEDVVRTCDTVACLANAGDIWAYSTPILHASDRALRPERRRVLQIDFSGDDLPGGLEWATPWQHPDEATAT